MTTVNHSTNCTTGIRQPSAKLDIPLTHGNSSSALGIFSAQEDPTLSCGPDNKLRVFLSAAPGDSIHLSHYVSSGGALLESGERTVEVTDDDGESERRFAEQLGSDVVVMEGLGERTPEEGDTSKRRVLVSTDISLARPFSDEGQVAKYVNVLVYTRDAREEGLSATAKFLAESCAPIPVLR